MEVLLEAGVAVLTGLPTLADLGAFAGEIARAESLKIKPAHKSRRANDSPIPALR